MTKLSGQGTVRKGLDANPRVLEYDEAFMDGRNFMVVLAHGFAFDDAAAHYGDDPDGRFACHNRSFATQAEALEQINDAMPCVCGRCAPQEQEYVDWLDGLDFSPRLDDACQYSTVYRAGKPLATLQRRRYMESGPTWTLYSTDGKEIGRLWLRVSYQRVAQRASFFISKHLGE